MKSISFWLLAPVALLLAIPAMAADTVYYYSSDTLHSEVVVTDQNRNVVERTHYAPYGQVLDRDLRDGPGYTGHEEDPETNLVYMQQRYYDPEAGRFLSTDPVQADGGGGSFNRYAYAADNPYRFIDPDGRANHDARLPPPSGCTGSHIGGGACGSLNLKSTQVGSPSVSEQRAAIYGTAQNSRNTPTHATTSQRIANEAASNPNTERVHLNQRLQTVTGDPTHPALQPDVTVVNKDGSIDMYEVRSAGQSEGELITKMARMRAAIGVSGANRVVEPDPLPMGGGTVLRALGPLGVLEMILHQAAVEHEAQKAAAQEQTTCDPRLGCS